MTRKLQADWVQEELAQLLAETPEVTVADFVPGADLEASRRPMSAEEAAALCEKGSRLCEHMKRGELSDLHRNRALNAVIGILTRLKRERLVTVLRDNSETAARAVLYLDSTRKSALRSYETGKRRAAKLAEKRELMSV